MDTFDQTAALVLGIIVFCFLILAPSLWSTREDRRRARARRLMSYMEDGRPRGCKCPPNPGMNAMPCDNTHIGSQRCPLTVPTITTSNAEELAALTARVDQLSLALKLLHPEHDETCRHEPPDTSWVQTGRVKDH